MHYTLHIVRVRTTNEHWPLRGLQCTYQGAGFAGGRTWEGRERWGGGSCFMAANGIFVLLRTTVTSSLRRMQAFPDPESWS